MVEISKILQNSLFSWSSYENKSVEAAECVIGYLYDIETPEKIKITPYEQKAYDKVGRFFQPNELDVLTSQYCVQIQSFIERSKRGQCLLITPM